MSAPYPTNVEVHRWAEQQPWGHKVSGPGMSRELIKAWDRAHPDRPYVKAQAYHGTPSGYGRGCRCRPCTDAKVAYTEGNHRNAAEASA